MTDAYNFGAIDAARNFGNNNPFQPHTTEWAAYEDGFSEALED